MPIDRPNQNTQRPLKPTLASNRTAKTPLTPRLAATSTTRTTNGVPPRAAVAADTATPTKPYLSSNVTPRSSTRKSRVGVDSISPNTTPGVTPTSSRPSSTIDYHKEQGISYSYGITGSAGPQGGLKPRGAAASGVSQTTPTPRLPLSGVNRQTSSDASVSKDVSSLFFHADDVRSPELPSQQKKASVFFHANGKADEPARTKSAASPPSSSLGKSQSESKFFHADSLQEPRDRSPALSPPHVSPSTEPLSPHNAAATATASLRPASPSKEWAHLSYRKGASQVIRPGLNSRNSALSIIAGQNTPDLPDSARRRSSASQSTVKFSHAKSASLSSIDSVSDIKKTSMVEHSTMTPSPLHTENRLINESSMRDSIASAPSPPLAALSGLSSPVPMSPNGTTGTKTALETMNELAASARRERKVLDLEISNSSLLAINRSLEKEIRKQKAEIRRFRRLSRTGRFPADVGGSSSELLSSIRVGSYMEGLSEMSEEEEGGGGEEDEEEEEERFVEEPEELEEPEDSESSLDEGTLSPTVQAERDEAHRFGDEKRLQLDLSKHRELLVDSQKMNQSLKRCLGWTEQLIKDGQKALEYKVNVSDVKLGGRVLVSEDDHDDAPAEESKGLLSPWSPLHTAIDALDSPFFTEASRLVDRDSGIDMDAMEAMEHASGVPLPASPSRASSQILDKEFRPRVPGRWESYATTTRPQSGVLDDLPSLGSPFEEKLRDLHASIDALETS